MINISTNIEEAYHDLDKVFDKLKDSDKVLRSVAFDGLAMIADRVQQQGKKTDGSGLKTKSKKFFGVYSEAYGNKRKQDGRRVDQVDLTMTGDMFNDFIVEPTGQYEYSGGFRGEKSAQKAEYAELYYGPIFVPSDEEIEFLSEQLNKNLDAIFGQ